MDPESRLRLVRAPSRPGRPRRRRPSPASRHSLVAEHRVAFEEEMGRHRQELEDELRRFWRARHG